MLRSAVIAFSALALATILDWRAADAAAISALDLSRSEPCVGCAHFESDDRQILLDWSIRTETTPLDIAPCSDQSTFVCRNPAEDSVSRETEPWVGDSSTVISAGDLLAPVASDSTVGWDDYSRLNNCANFESQFRYPNSSEDGCGSVKPGSDYSELISALTLSIVSVLAFALIALGWLLHRAYRIRRLQRMIRHGRSPHLHQGRRRADDAVSG
jgi:hypothetical protein